GVSGADFYTVFYTAGWDALGRTGPGRHAAAGTAWQIGCPRPAVGRRSGSSVVSLTGAALCPVGRLGPALDAAWRLFRIESKENADARRHPEEGRQELRGRL